MPNMEAVQLTLDQKELGLDSRDTLGIHCAKIYHLRPPSADLGLTSAHYVDQAAAHCETQCASW